MPLSGRIAAAVVACLLVSVAAGVGATASGSEDPPPFIGLDGREHTVSPFAIPGKHGYLYIGEDFDTACAFGAHLLKAMKSISRVADILERGGRRVLFTVGPNKSVVVDAANLPDPPPQGRCSRLGMEIQSRELDGYRDPRYIPVREALAATAHSYWRTDTHWNSIGTSVFATSLAQELSPRLAQLQHYHRASRTHQGDLTAYMSSPVGPETGPARVPDNGVRTRPVDGSPAYDPSLTSVYTDLSWASRPAKKTFPGRTLVLGDSFGYVATEALSNLFRRGRFMWIGYQSISDVAAAVKQADTIVICLVQRYLPIDPLADPTYQNELRADLRQ